MSLHYFYRCTHCQQTLAADEVESHFIYLCPNCGEAKPNSPLKGVLEVIYDYAAVNANITKERFLQLPAGQPWLYPWLWPLTFEKGGSVLTNLAPSLLQNLRLPQHQLLHFKHGDFAFSVLDETRNPTFSFKDRASILVVLKALQLGISQIAAASTGNAGSSLAGICARSGLKAQIWVPQSIPEAKLLQIKAYGATVHKVAGDYDLAFDRSIEVSRQKGWYNRNTAYNPLTIEGKKSAAYDIFIQTGGQLPEVIFVPVGDGVIIAGLFKGFWELRELGWIKQLPRLVAVQASGSNAVVRFVQQGVFRFSPAQTVADSISAGAPRNLYLAVQAVKQSNGTALEVDDQEILRAQAQLARRYGVLAEPAAAASFAGFLKAIEQQLVQPENRVLLLITGNGLKDTKALQATLQFS